MLLLSFIYIFSSLQISVLATPPAAPLRVSSKDLTPEHAQNPDIVTAWVKAKWSNYDAIVTKLTFYSNKDVGAPMLEAWLRRNPGYFYYWDIFDDDFYEDFRITKELQEQDDHIHPIIEACSVVMAEIAVGDVRVFNHDHAKRYSAWLTTEYPILYYSDRVTNIWNMQDNTLALNGFTTSGRKNLKDRGTTQAKRSTSPPPKPALRGPRRNYVLTVAPEDRKPRVALAGSAPPA